jgi:hypothetical protein
MMHVVVMLGRREDNSERKKKERNDSRCRDPIILSFYAKRIRRKVAYALVVVLA